MRRVELVLYHEGLRDVIHGAVVKFSFLIQLKWHGFIPQTNQLIFISSKLNDF